MLFYVFIVWCESILVSWVNGAMLGRVWHALIQSVNSLFLFRKDGRLNMMLKCLFSLCHNRSKCAQERSDSLTSLLSFLLLLVETFELHINTVHCECLFLLHRCMHIYRYFQQFPCAASPDVCFPYPGSLCGTITSNGEVWYTDVHDLNPMIQYL